jgi:hypothetical protein
MFHLNNNDEKAAREKPDYDSLFKIRPVIDTLVTHVQDVYTPEEQLTIEKVICSFQGPILFCVYIRGKPHKHGIKMFELCEQKMATSTTWKYARLLGNIPQTQNTAWHSVMLTRCVTNIRKGPLCVNGQLIFDYLWACKTKAVGTVTSNRKQMYKHAFSGKLKER